MVAFSDVQPAKLKLRALPSYPARIDGQKFIVPSVANGVLSIGVDYSIMNPIPYVDLANKKFVVWDTVTDSYGITSIQDAVGGVTSLGGEVGDVTAGTGIVVDAGVISANLDGVPVHEGTILTAGTGGQTRDLGVMLAELPVSTNWDTPTHAATAVHGLGGGTIFIPGGIAVPTLPSTYDDVMWDYLGPSIVVPELNTVAGVGQTTVRRLFKVKPSGPHSSGIARYAIGIDSQAVGSGTNGPGDTDGGLFISAVKQNWHTTTDYGQVDGITVLIRNGGPNGTINAANSSDASAYAADVGIKLNSGFAVVMESGTKIFNADGTIARSQSIQIGGILSTPGSSASNGIVLGPSVGSMDNGILFGSTTAAPIVNLIRHLNSAGERFKIDGLSQVFIYPNDGTSAGYVKLLNGSATGDLEFLTSGGAVFFTVDAATGDITTTGKLNGQTDRGIVLINQTSSAAGATATFTNAPAAGNPIHYLRVKINGVNGAIPVLAG